MPVPVDAQKDRIQELLNCIGNGLPINPPREGWNVHEMLCVAGAMYFGAMSHGPHWIAKHQAIEAMPLERREAIEETFMEDLLAAIGFYGQLSMLVADNEFSQTFEDRIIAVVHRDTVSGQLNVAPYTGFKK